MAYLAFYAHVQPDVFDAMLASDAVALQREVADLVDAETKLRVNLAGRG